jgi:NADPH:quinone reductase-like Zn-dependent oxidoreductase
MKAVCLIKNTSKGGIFEIREKDTPLPKENEVQIKIEYFGINFADVMAGFGLYQAAPPLPSVLGYECTGYISAVGKNVSSEKIGKRVLAFTRFGSYAEFVCAPELGVVELPDSIKNEDALPLGTQYCTAWYAAMEMVVLQPENVVLIHAGAGGVGTALTQICKWKGCTVIALSGSDEKKDYILKNGADHFINYKKTDYEKEIKKIFPEGIDISFNAVAGSTFKKDKRLLSVGGRIVLFGAAERMGGKLGFISTLGLLFKIGFFSPVFMMMKTQGIIGVNMLNVGDKKPEVLKRCMINVVELTDKGIFKPFTSKIFDTNETGLAHQIMSQGKTIGKIGIKWK